MLSIYLSFRSPLGVKLADSEKKRLLEVARRNAINMLKNGAVPAGAAVLPPHTRNQVMAAIHSGGIVFNLLILFYLPMLLQPLIVKDVFAFLYTYF